MPQQSALWGLAFLALFFAPGAEALVCGADQYLHFNAGNTAVACSACPTGMGSAAGVAGGFGDSADPRIAATILAKGANKVLTFCNVKPGYYHATSTTATSVGTAIICPVLAPFVKTTSVEQLITGPITLSTAAILVSKMTRCSAQSKCAVNEYLSMDAQAATNTQAAFTICTACPAGMSALAGASQPAQTLLVTEISKVTGASTLAIGTYCNVNAGSYLATSTTAALIGSTLECGQLAPFASTTSVLEQIAAIGTTGVSLATLSTAAILVSKLTRCSMQSKCAVDKYLSMAAQAATNTQAAFTICTACPAGMTALAGASQPPTNAGFLTEISKVTGASTLAIGTYCNVPTGKYLSTATTAAVIGAVTACPASYTTTTSSGLVLTPTTGAAAVSHDKWIECAAQKLTTGPTGLTGPAGAAGAAGASGAAGAAGSSGAAGAAGSGGSAGSAGTASPAAPLSTVTAAVFGAVVPAILIFV